jgi:hypothetical protein
VRAPGSLLEPLVEPAGADDQPAETPLQLRQLPAAARDLARQAAKDRGAVEQRGGTEHRIDAGLARDLELKALERAQPLLGRDRTDRVEVDLERRRPACAAVSLESLVALARGVVRRQVRDVRGPGIERERGRRQDQEREDRECGRDAGLAGQPVGEPDPRVRAARGPQRPAVDVRAEQCEPGRDREESCGDGEQDGDDHPERRGLEQRARGDQQGAEHAHGERRPREDDRAPRPSDRYHDRLLDGPSGRELLAEP